MNRRLRIGLIAEGPTELGSSFPYIKPEDGGKLIPRENEGALHTLIRRELKDAGLPDCDFVHRHPSTKEIHKGKVASGFGVLEKLSYLSQVVSTWKPEEVDLIIILVDADDKVSERQKTLKKALKKIQEYHLDVSENIITDQSCGGLAIRNFETWLIADCKTVSSILESEFVDLADLENLEQTKDILETAIAHSVYLREQKNRSMMIRWYLAEKINLGHLKKACPQGYGTFAQELIAIAQRFSRNLS